MPLTEVGKARRPMDDDDGKQRLLSSLTQVRLEDKPTFDLAFSTLKRPISDDCFAATFMWAEALRVTWAMLHRHVCVFANGAEDLTLLHPPIGLPGAGDAEFAAAIADSFEVMDEYNAAGNGRERSRIEYVSDEALERVSACSPFPLSASPLWADYVYDTNRLITLEGGDLKSKRHARSKFLREFPEARAEPLEERHLPACTELLARWASHGDRTHDGEVNDAHVGTDLLRYKDHLATATALRHYRELGLSGMVVMVGDRLAGFTLGLGLSPLQSMVLIEKTAPEFPGCPQFIFSEFCRTALAAYPECNAGDDWGIPTLRFTKQSYRPIRLLNKYVLARTALPVAVPLPSRDVPALVPEPLPPNMTVTAKSNPGVALRPANASDIEALLEIERDCFEAPEDQFSRRQIRALMANPRSMVFVAEEDGKRLGWAVGLIRHHRHWRSGRIYAVGVHSSARGRGIGRLLTERLLEEFRSRSILRVYLEVRETNSTALSLYRALGFVPVRRLPAYYGPGGDGISCRVILRPVSDPARA